MYPDSFSSCCATLLIHTCRFFVLLSGLAHVTLPNGTDDVWILEGVNQLIVAADTVGEGHFTDYPSDNVTVALQIPFANNIAPDHKVLRDGACESAQVGYRAERFGAAADELKMTRRRRA
jgi:hypothetical protein